MRITISEEGQITIPKRLREYCGFAPDVDLELILTEEGMLIRKKVVGAGSHRRRLRHRKRWLGCQRVWEHRRVSVGNSRLRLRCGTSQV